MRSLLHKWALSGTHKRSRIGLKGIVAAVVLGGGVCFGQDAPADLSAEANDFASMNLEQLMRIEVTSVAGVGAEWFSTPAAISVITADDIRRTGHTSIAEALRLVPGLQVGQISSNVWTVNSRGGFGGRFSNSVLVMIDGRTVYEPIFSGVYWHLQDMVLEDLDRIEAIRGPGATLWGSNAVNGVINVISKHARDTQGLLLSGGGGNLEQGFASVRYGDKINDDDAYFRVWGKYANHAEFETSSGEGFNDDWDMSSLGARMDFGADDETHLTLDGALHYSDRVGLTQIEPSLITPFSTGDESFFTGHLLARMEHTISETSGWKFQGSYGRIKNISIDGFETHRDELEADFRHYFQLGSHNQIMWGVGTLRYWDDNAPGSQFLLDPEHGAYGDVTTFIQDTITLAPDRLFLMAGAKFEYNDSTGFEVQPSARLWWTPTDRHTIWGAIARPVRTPSRIETNSIIFGAPGAPNIVGNPDLDSVTLTSYEAGYRQKINEKLTIDLASYFNQYDQFIGIVPTPQGLTHDNAGEATTYGAELAATWQVADNWRLQGSYTFNHTDIRDLLGADAQEAFPDHQFQIRSSLDITKNLDFDTVVYFYDRIDSADIDAFFRLDTGLTWRPRPNVEIAVWGQNLLDNQHAEFQDVIRQRLVAEVPRSIYARVTLRF